MKVFGNYARYYDLLYRDKDYVGEADYVCRLIREHVPEGIDLLELGCGTGRHAELLGDRGFNVVGIDTSEEMLEQARSRVDERQAGEGGTLSFDRGDVRDFRVERPFDAVISLFHVVSYQTSNDDLRGMFRCVQQHLKPGGVFVFDVWYGPAVLAQQPSVRVLRLEDDALHVTRMAEPALRADQNIVEVNYEIIIRDKQTGEQESVKEVHRMRYLFGPELELLLSEAGMQIQASEEWMTRKKPGCDTWGVCFVAKPLPGTRS